MSPAENATDRGDCEDGAAVGRTVVAPPIEARARRDPERPGAAAPEMDRSAPLAARVGPGDATVRVSEDTAIRFDAEGRWCSLRWGQRLVRRTLDGEVVSRVGYRVVPAGGDDARAAHEAAIRLARALREDLELERRPVELRGEVPDRALLLEQLRRAAGWTPERYAGESDRFREAYPERVPILPPDRYGDVVVLPAVGCPHGKCTFCAFYARVPFRALATDELEQHLAAVRRFFGRGLGARSGVFLGSASALSLAQRSVVHVLARVSDAFGRFPRGISAFQDPDHAPRRTTREYVELLEAGLSQVFLGLESGWGTLREALGKPASLARFVEAVERAKTAGLRVALSVLVGAGGREAAHRHREETARIVGELPLDSTDLVFLSPLAGSMPPAELEDQLARFRERLSDIPAKLAPYRIDLFRYFS